MPTYQFICRRGCGSFERSFAMAAAPAVTSCPQCAGASRRCFGGALIQPGSAASRLLEATNRTATEPAVVHSLPAGRSATVTRNPLHRKLPRP